ncbi:MAG: PQQ-binding-like beta-propeller repeat protein [Verrucomicrobiae bacterium]|nr:PQQ-binding-like beta-propeller repeat protein [Verrucomicrobiae bacterium]
MPMKHVFSTLAILVSLLLGHARADVSETARQILRASGAPGGICAILGATDAALALAIAQHSKFVVHCLAPDANTCNALRKAIRASGLYGTVSAEVHRGDQLPYADNLVNLIVTGGEFSVSRAEIMRVLAPHGIAIAANPKSEVQNPKLLKPWPSDMDEWTHYLHGADGNPVANDRVVGPPRHYQWITGPMWLRCHETDSSVSTLVTAQGRLFAIVDEAPIGLAGQHSLPDKWFLVARDAFNGVLLWKVPIRRWGWREWKDTWFGHRAGDIPLNIQKRLVAVGDKVYVTLGYQAPVSQLDARTGEILQTYAGTERANEILFHNGVLVLSVLSDDGAKVMVVNADTGKTLWASAKTFKGSTTDYIKWTISPVSPTIPKLDPALNIATDGKVVALIDGPEIVGLDARTGVEKWRAAFPLDDDDKKRGSSSDLWVGTMIVRDGVVLHASPSKLAAFSTDTGLLLWSQPKKFIGHLWYEWKEVFVIGDLVWTWSAELESGAFERGLKGKQRTYWPKTVNGYDLKTGALKRQVPLGQIFAAHHHHRCYRNKATVRYILASRRGTEYVDLENGQHTVHNWVRSTCHVGMMPANGLQYVPPHPCQCYIEEKLNGFFALAPARRGERKAESGARLERGPAFSEISNLKSETSDADWPVFRQNPARTGSVNTQVPDNAAPLWNIKLGNSATPPIIVGDRVFVAIPDEHHIICLDARDGKKLWEFGAGGRVDSPPAWHNGTVLFGAADGRVYCLRAADGALAWRFRAAAEERLICVFGQLESAWPVHGSVLALDNKVYLAAGRSSQLDGGIHLYALDAATGKVLHETKLEGPDYAVNAAGKLVMRPPPADGPAEFETNFGLPQGHLTDVLMFDNDRLFMRLTAFDKQLKLQQGKPDLLPHSGFLDDTYFKRTPWTFQGEYGNLIAHDKDSAYFVRQFDSLKGLDPMVFFTPGAKGYLLFAKNVGARKSRWSLRVPVRVRAMAQTRDRLFVAGPPDVVDPQDPLGAFEGRLGGLLYAVDSASGKKLAEWKLDAPPVLNGMAAARGRLFVATTDGKLLCMGRR